MEDTFNPNIPAKQVGRAKLVLGSALFITLLILAGIFLHITKNTEAPSDFPVGTIIKIAPGMSVAEIAADLEEKSVVASEFILYIVLLTYYDPTDIKASDYIFTEPLNVFAVAKRLVEGDFDSSLINFTHLEGERVNEIAANAEKTLQNFDSVTFVDHALPLEGKLFPDTYRIPPDYTADELIALMTTRFEEAISPLREKIEGSNLTEDEVIILASILEREANTPESMKMVSGILQNRLNIIMPLQVDASIEYILDKPLGELVPADLTIDSPYNTYTNFGLPPTPIGNPGLTSIMAAIEPTPSDFLFYITGDDGEFYFAKTFDEHKQNIARHLR